MNELRSEAPVPEKTEVETQGSAPENTEAKDAHKPETTGPAEKPPEAREKRMEIRGEQLAEFGEALFGLTSELSKRTSFGLDQMLEERDESLLRFSVHTIADLQRQQEIPIEPLSRAVEAAHRALAEFGRARNRGTAENTEALRTLGFKLSHVSDAALSLASRIGALENQDNIPVLARLHRLADAAQDRRLLMAKKADLLNGYLHR